MSQHHALQLPPNAGRGLRVVIVQAMFNESMTSRMVHLCKNTLIEHGVLPNDIIVETVPGALEIPVAIKWCESHYQPQAMIALGCVIRGETYHFEIVSEQSARAIMDLSLSLDEHKGMGIANGILTCNTQAQAEARAETVAKHCAETALLLALLKAKSDDKVAI